MGQCSNSFPKHFSYLCEYAIRFDLSCGFCEYPLIFHCLHCSPSCFDPDSLLLAYLWLGLSWIHCISANKSFSSSKTSSRKPYTSSKQQERHKHSVEITINFSTPLQGHPPPQRRHDLHRPAHQYHRQAGGRLPHQRPSHRAPGHPRQLPPTTHAHPRRIGHRHPGKSRPPPSGPLPRPEEATGKAIH